MHRHRHRTRDSRTTTTMFTPRRQWALNWTVVQSSAGGSHSDGAVKVGATMGGPGGLHPSRSHNPTLYKHYSSHAAAFPVLCSSHPNSNISHFPHTSSFFPSLQNLKCQSERRKNGLAGHFCCSGRKALKGQQASLWLWKAAFLS